MADPEKTAGFLESLTAGYACRSWFCRDRGPFLTMNLEAAEQLAAEHRALRWLGLWRHRVIVYRLDGDQRRGGQALADFMRRAARGDENAADSFRTVRGGEADSGGEPTRSPRR